MLFGATSNDELSALAQTYFAAYNEILSLLNEEMARTKMVAAGFSSTPFTEPAFLAREVALAAERFYVNFINKSFQNFTEEEKDSLKGLLETSGPALQEYWQNVVQPLIQYPSTGFYPTPEAKAARDVYADTLATGSLPLDIAAAKLAFDNAMISAGVPIVTGSTQKLPLGLIAAAIAAWVMFK